MTKIETKYINHMGTDLTVVNSARVSFGKTHSEMTEGDAKLIKYLAKHRHTSPFGHCFASFHVKAPVFVARQLVKHKFLRWNEISKRYMDNDPEFYDPEVWRGRSADKKQGSSDAHITHIGNDLVNSKVWLHNGRSLILYREMIDAGIAPEQARAILPLSTFTEWHWSGSLDAFADMAKLRLKDDTQEETRLVAQGIDRIMKLLFPLSWAALLENENE